jgi:hypothetical protein
MSAFGPMMKDLIKDAMGWLRMKEVCHVETFTGAFFREDEECFPVFQMEMSFVKAGHTEFEAYKFAPRAHNAN